MYVGDPHVTQFVVINIVINITNVNVKLTLEVLIFHVYVNQCCSNRYIGKSTRTLVITFVSKWSKLGICHSSLIDSNYILFYSSSIYVL
jgi:hypothetical protein